MIHHLKNALTIFLALTGLWLTTSAQTRSDRYSQGSSRSGYSNNRLSGTWRLNSGRSDNPRVAAERATRNLDVNDRQRAQENLLRRLGAPHPRHALWRSTVGAKSGRPGQRLRSGFRAAGRRPQTARHAQSLYRTTRSGGRGAQRL